MKAVIRPAKGKGVIAAPPSKSDSHRALICAALSAGVSRVGGLSPSQDILATIDCLTALGAEIVLTDGTATVTGLDWDALRSGSEPLELPCRESGSTLRFLTPVALLTGRRVTLSGSASLFRRPLEVYRNLCAAQGLDYSQTETSITVMGRLASGRFPVPGNVSSQFISGLLFALPLLDGASEIAILPPMESTPYIEMTLHTLGCYGIRAEFADQYTLAVPGGQRYAPTVYPVEGDWSNAAFLEALNLLGGEVTVTGLDPESLQGDRVCRSHFAAMAAGTPVLDLTDCPDLGPVCMAMAAALHGAELTGTRRLRLKESDRCAAMAAELAKFGVHCTVSEDRMTVPGSALTPPTEALDGWNDHRIVMSLALLCTRTGGCIVGAEAVRKSFPDFFEVLSALGIPVTKEF